MTRRHTTRFTVEFGDCDPARIVHYPNFFKWIDAASRHFFVAAGVASWSELEAKTGIIGTPLVDVSARFLRPATYGDEIAIESWIDEWRGKSFVMKHVIRRGDEILVEGEETRIFARRRPDDPKRIQAVEAPEAIKKMVA
jgi:4-hydroxybenzoyl-CoA thioesterase